MLQYTKDGGAFLELAMKPKPVRGVQVRSFYVHGHLATNVDVSPSEFWKTLGANDFTCMHVKMNASRKWGPDEEAKMAQLGIWNHGGHCATQFSIARAVQPTGRSGHR